MFGKHRYLTKELPRANTWQGSCVSREGPPAHLEAVSQRQLYPVQPQLRRKHWLEPDKHRPASLSPLTQSQAESSWNS